MRTVNGLWTMLLALSLLAAVGCKDDEGTGSEKGEDQNDTEVDDLDSSTDVVQDSDTDKGDSEEDTGVEWDTTHAPDDVAASGQFAQPPGELDPADVPMFVSIGFDDNSSVEGMEWILDFLEDKTNGDGSPCRVSFYVNTGYIWDDPDYTGVNNTGGAVADVDALKAVWLRAYNEGHEIANHTQHHRKAYSQWSNDAEDDWTIADWEYEVDTCTAQLVAMGILEEDIVGFRTPYLGYNDDLYTVLADRGIAYDCSMEEGWQIGHNGTNFNWPYDLKDGSQVDTTLMGWCEGNADCNMRDVVGAHPGVWEIPVHPVVAPPDYRCEEYGIPAGFRARIKSNAAYFDEPTGKMTGLDYNLMPEFGLNGPEMEATLKYTLDLRLKGNRAPMVFGAHSQYYAQGGGGVAESYMTVEDRRAAIEGFLEYALDKEEDVRIIPSSAILEWIMDNQ